MDDERQHRTDALEMTEVERERVKGGMRLME